MIGPETRLFERRHDDRGVPHGREARPKPERVTFLDFEVGQVTDLARGERIIGGVAQSEQRKHGVHHGGVDGPKPVAAFQVFEEPLPRPAQGQASQRLPRKLFVELGDSIERQEQITPAHAGAFPGEHGDELARVSE